MSDEIKMSASGLPGDVGVTIDTFLEKSLGISPKNFDSFRSDSDWAMVVKLHAYIEATLNHLLVKHFKDERLYPIISKLDVSDQTKGKLALIKALDLLPKEDRSFIKQLSVMRNSLVHDAKNLEFNFEKYLAELDAQKKKDLKGAMIPILKGFIEGMTDEQVDRQFNDHFKASLIVAASSIMIKVYDKDSAKPSALLPDGTDQSTPKAP